MLLHRRSHIARGTEHITVSVGLHGTLSFFCRALQERDQREAEKVESVEQSDSSFCTYALSYEKGSRELIIDAEVVGNVSRYARQNNCEFPHGGVAVNAYLIARIGVSVSL